MTAQFASNRQPQGVGNRQQRRKAQATSQAPDPDRINRLTQLLSQQQFPEGASYAQRFCKRWPDHPLGWTVLGMCLTALGNFEEAEPVLKRAVPLAPENAAVANCLGVVLKALGKAAEARSVFGQALNHDRNFVEARFNLAQTLRDLDMHEESITELKGLLLQAPQHAEARMALAHSLKETGSFGAAEAEYRTLLGHGPSRAEALFHLSAVKTYTREDDDLKTILSLLNRKPESPNERIHLHFAAGKAFMDMNDEPETAFAHFQTGNALKRAMLRYDVSTEVGHMNRIVSHFPDVTCIASAAPSDVAEPAPIFIVGMPRSGTTLVEQILASHRAVTPGGERKDLERSAKAFEARSGVPFPAWQEALGGAEAEELGRDYLGGLREVDPNARWITDKMPANIKLIGLAAKCLPMAKFVHVRRQPLDTCFSCYTQLFTEGNAFSYDLFDLAHYYNAYQTLAAHWEAKMPADRLFSVDYETLIAEPEPTIKRLLAFFELDWDPHCLQFHRTVRPVKTASAAQVRKPLYRSSVGRWEPYKEHLKPLIEGLSNGAAWVPGSAIC